MVFPHTLSWEDRSTGKTKDVPINASLRDILPKVRAVIAPATKFEIRIGQEVIYNVPGISNFR